MVENSCRRFPLSVSRTVMSVSPFFCERKIVSFVSRDEKKARVPSGARTVDCPYCSRARRIFQNSVETPLLTVISLDHRVKPGAETESACVPGFTPSMW